MPRNLEVAEVNRHSITLEWQPPRNDGGTPVLSYVVERRPGHSSRFVRVANVLDTWYRDTGIYGDSDYEYRVIAENETGPGQPCKPVGPVVAKDPFGTYYFVSL